MIHKYYSKLRCNLKRDSKMNYLGVLIITVALINQFAFLAQVVVDSDSIKNYLSAVLASVLVDQTNEARIKNELSELKVSEKLTEAAQLKANDMASREYFAHNTPEGNPPWYWLDEVGYGYQKAGENLAVNFDDSIEVTDAWLKSVSHRANLLNGKYTEIGIATAEGLHKGKKAVYVAQFFGTPVVQTNILPSSEKVVPVVEKEIYFDAKPEVLGISADKTPGDVIEVDSSFVSFSPDNLSLSRRIMENVFVILILLTALYSFYGLIHKRNKYVTQSILLVIIISTFLYINTIISPTNFLL